MGANTWGIQHIYMNYEKVKNQQERCKTEWFKNHKAEVITDETNQRGNTMVVNFSAPNTWNYGCRLIIHRRWLIVVGDMGEAVYEWGEDLTLQFLNRIDFGYFYGKCQASEEGRRLTFWDATEAIESIKYYHKEYGEDNPKLGRALNELLERVDRHTQRADFEEYLRRAYDEGHVDGEILSAIKSSGDQPHPRSIAHFVGLQMAIEQLTKNEEKTEANTSNAGKV